jgi:hypothetical protein
MATRNEGRNPPGVVFSTPGLLLIAGERGMIPDEAMPAAKALTRAAQSALHHLALGTKGLAIYAILARGLFQRVPDDVPLSAIPLAVASREALALAVSLPGGARGERGGEVLEPEYRAPVTPRGRGRQSIEATITPDELSALQAWFQKTSHSEFAREVPPGEFGAGYARVCKAWAEAIPRIIARAKHDICRRYSISAEKMRAALEPMRGRPGKPASLVRLLALLRVCLDEVAAKGEALPAEVREVRRAIPTSGLGSDHPVWSVRGTDVAAALKAARADAARRANGRASPLDDLLMAVLPAQSLAWRCAREHKRQLTGEARNPHSEAAAIMLAIQNHMSRRHPLVSSGAWDKAVAWLAARGE